MNPALRLPVLVCCLAGLPAAELVVRDIRLGVGVRPTAFDFNLDNGASTRSGSDAYDGAIAIDTGLRWSFARPGDAIGVIVGVDLGLEAGAYGGGDGYQALNARLCAGPAWAINDRWNLALELGVGAGACTLDLPKTVAAEALSLSGTQHTLDVRAVLDAKVTPTFAIGLMAGWASTTQNLRGNSQDLSIDLKGFQAGLEFRWRFDSAPTLLE